MNWSSRKLLLVLCTLTLGTSASRMTELIAKVSFWG